MKIHYAVIKEQGVTFAIVIVKKHIINFRSHANEIVAQLCAIFPRMPVILMAQDSRGIPTYFGRPDIVRFLTKIPLSCIRWKSGWIS